MVALGHLAHAFLAVVRAEEHIRRPAPVGLIALTCNEIQRLFTTAVSDPCVMWPFGTTTTAPCTAGTTNNLGARTSSHGQQAIAQQLYRPRKPWPLICDLAPIDGQQRSLAHAT